MSDNLDAWGTHRWSGWPGAFCLDCGVEDEVEYCVSQHNVALICTCHDIYMPQDGQDHEFLDCPEHMNTPCLLQGRYKRETGL